MLGEDDLCDSQLRGSRFMQGISSDVEGRLPTGGLSLRKRVLSSPFSFSWHSSHFLLFMNFSAVKSLKFPLPFCVLSFSLSAAEHRKVPNCRSLPAKSRHCSKLLLVAAQTILQAIKNP
ncbi:hypothetical protein M413DRAFT_231500 [Hebeloma cylindrosporum]|uniref:Uncharacterized protein n=1 Tax=Hebeloma cylindrosporum TaxID=76867 RepID=A0A0C3CX66_HEBCY|nr:hypothetical protein M413DRAFT_231500 [Hebeloma cylindrosporum h7]